MKILLTGGAGYVGSACLRWLLDHGHDPIAYDNLSEGNVAAVPDAPNRLIVGDIAETDRLAEVLRRARRRGGDALRGAGVGPRLDRRSRGVLPRQRRWNQERARRHAHRRGAQDPLQQHGGDLWVPRRDAAARGLAPDARDPLRHDQARRRVADQGLRPGLRSGLHLAAVLQRLGCRSRRRLRRGPPPREPPDPARSSRWPSAAGPRS